VWTRAAEYYQNALLILPDNGNPHNQLAVLATYRFLLNYFVITISFDVIRYEDDSFSGVYRYFRSLAIRQPFLTARDNLKAQFEKNRLKLETEDINQRDEGNVDLLLARYTPIYICV
jgi:protein SMG7